MIALRRLRPILWLALVLVLGLAPPAALAHAELVQAQPSPGSGLPQAPARVVVKFGEPLNLELSRVEVLDLAGEDVAEGETLPVPGDPTAMQRRLGLLPVGQYTVRWTTVSTLDGHTLRGTFRFGVGTAASADVAVAEGPLDSEGAIGLAGRMLLLLGLGLWAGVAVLGPRMARAGLGDARADLLARLAPSLATLGMGLSLASSAIVAAGSLEAVPGVLASESGRWRLIVLAASLAGAVAGPRPRAAAVALAGMALLAEGASGHAASSPMPLPAGLVFSIHLGAAGVWVFLIAAALLSRERVRDVLAEGTPYAVLAAALVGITGVASAAFVLSGPDDLLTTEYGQILLAKTLVTIAMASLGVLHLLRRRAMRASLHRLRLVVRGESAAAVLTLALATLLVGFPDSPRDPAVPEGTIGSSPLAEVLTDGEAVSVAEAWGPYIIGLTIVPPRPGPVTLRVSVLGLEAGDAPRNVRVRSLGLGEGPEIQLDECALGCFEGRATLDADANGSFEVTITTNRGPVRVGFALPIPAPDGDGLFERALAAMEDLRSARIIETLRGSTDGPTVVARYAFEAPDAMTISVGESERIVIGDSDYRRRDGSGEWERFSWPSRPFRWPASYYRTFWAGATAARIIGTEELAGERVHVLAFVTPALPAWFRVWVDDEGIVHRMEMRAEGHLMQHAYSHVNAAIEIRPPLAGSEPGAGGPDASDEV